MTKPATPTDRPARRALQRAAVCFLALAGCVPPIARSHVAVPLPSGEPRTPCETARWVDLEETQLSASTTTGSGWLSYTLTTTERGFALYRRREGPEGAPVDVGLALPSLAEPSLAGHMRPVEALRERQRTALMVLSAGGAIATTSLSVTALFLGTDASTDSGLQVAMLVGVGLGALTMLVSPFFAPSASERNHASLRERLFVPGEDDLDAVRRGVARYNLAMRARCLREPVAARTTR